MMRVINLILCFFLGIVSLLTDPYLFLVVIFYLLVVYFIFPRNSMQFFNVFLFVFLLIGVISVYYCNIYINLYGNSRGPYYDDSLYYFNAIYLSNFSFSLHPPTLFEVLLAIPHFLSRLIFGEYVKHLYLLPLNWIIAGFSIVYTLKIKDLLFPYLTLNNWFIASLIVFNFNFIDTAAHLYRDILLIFLIVLCFYKLLKQEYINALLFILLVFFIRGANGALLIFILFLLYFLYQKRYSLKKTFVFFLLPILIVLYLAPHINSSFFRGGFGSEDSVSLNERLSSRLEYNSLEDEGGSVALRNGNVIMRSFYPIVYTFSPFIGNFTNTDIYVRQADFNNILGYGAGKYTLPTIYKLPLAIHIIYIGTFWYGVIYGIILSIRSKNKKLVALGLFMIIQILAISIISMQARHRLPVIFLFPIFYCVFYSENKFKKSNIGLIGIFSVVFIVLYNLYLNL